MSDKKVNVKNVNVLITTINGKVIVLFVDQN